MLGEENFESKVRRGIPLIILGNAGLCRSCGLVFRSLKCCIPSLWSRLELNNSSFSSECRESRSFHNSLVRAVLIIFPWFIVTTETHTSPELGSRWKQISKYLNILLNQETLWTPSTEYMINFKIEKSRAIQVVFFLIITRGWCEEGGTVTSPSAPRLFANEAVKWLFYSHTQPVLKRFRLNAQKYCNAPFNSYDSLSLSLSLGAFLITSSELKIR